MGALTSRGSALIGVLLVLSLLLVMGLGLLSQRSNLYEEMRRANDAAQARALAQAGMVDAYIKLVKDPSFPQSRPSEDARLTYTETVRDTTGRRVGAYTVVVDTSRRTAPFMVVRVTSTGSLGEGTNPSGRYMIYGELDVSKTLREDPEAKNPHYYKWSFLREQSRPVPLVNPTPPW